jgi:hypothetical protein
LASQEGLFSVTLVVIHCDDLTVIVLKMYKGAAVISALMKVYSIPCHDRSPINVMLVLQSCTDPLHILPGSSSETFPTSSDGACNFSNMEVEEDIGVKEEGFIDIKEEFVIDIKQEEIPENKTFRNIKPEPDEVSYVCLFRHIFLCPGMSLVCQLFFGCQYFLPLETAPLLQMKMFVFLGGWKKGGGGVWGGWGFSTRWVF